jgi:hypothetical protein
MRLASGELVRDGGGRCLIFFDSVNGPRRGGRQER